MLAPKQPHLGMDPTNIEVPSPKQGSDELGSVLKAVKFRKDPRNEKTAHAFQTCPYEVDVFRLAGLMPSPTIPSLPHELTRSCLRQATGVNS